EFYGGTGFDFYGFRNGKFTTCPLDGRNISSCPEAYPYSDPGASKLTQCFKLENGVKKYFKIKLNSAPAAPATKKHSVRSATMPKKVVVKEIIFDESNSIIDEAFNDFEDFEEIDNLEI
ncbi:MAG: hypothetical protein J5611_01905, partial [Alphaproteobacteria bacterium]|nr:hypothetical protein [Alphaproteobacteria bacterium]